jgi:hypothetical protein
MTLPLSFSVVCIGTLSSSSEEPDTDRKLGGVGTYSAFCVFSNQNPFKANCVVPSLSDLACNCVGPSLSVSDLSTVLHRGLGVSFASLGFLNGFVTVF